MKFKLVVCVFFFTCDYLVKAHESLNPIDTTPEELPFHAVVRGKMICGGILLTENYVVTPAYCVYGSSSATVYLGFRGYPYYKSHHSESNTQILHCSTIFIHDDFAKVKDQHYLNNIALLRLSTPATLSNKVQPGKLVSRQEAQFLQGRFADISGWLVSVDENIKLATVQIRNHDTCNYLFGSQFLRSQQFCVKWSGKTRLNLLGNPVRVDKNIVGFQTNTPQCVVTSSSCTRNDMVLNFVPFLDWLSDKMDIPIEQFTSNSHESGERHDLTKLEGLISEINETVYRDKVNFRKYDESIASLNLKIENAVFELKQTRTEQNNFALSLNEQIGALKTEMSTRRARVDQNVVKLQEELNGVRTEVTNGLSAQRSVNDLEAKLTDLSNAVQTNVNEQLNKLEEQIKDLTNVTNNNKIEENEHFDLQQQQIQTLAESLNDVDIRGKERRQEINGQFSHINTTIDNVLSDQIKLQNELEGTRAEFKVHALQGNESVAKLKDILVDIAITREKHLLAENLRFNEIEKLFGEQRNDMDNHIIQEAAQVHSIWTDIKSLNKSVNKLTGYIFEEPYSN